MNPVVMSDGSLQNFTIRSEGKPFRCHCRCNVFHKPDDSRPDLYRCNACGEQYEGENAALSQTAKKGE